ncbi:MAG TPA: M20/M25/M40 family metallo-hydrolase [Gaiellales bacterium]|nr:M20/M25/M40 family metallo-hydrolase [Gaiellales bacterium]
MSETTELLARLVEVDSINPELVAGGAGEAAIAELAAGWLRERGLDARVEEVAPGRANAIATARGSGGGRSLLLCAHMDTVGVEGMAAPFDPRIEDGRMHGRGSFDMKGGLAAVMAAAAAVAGAGLRGDVVVAAVCDEEFESIGAESVAAGLTADAAIVTEPTGLEVCVAHKGFVWLDVETAGVAAHGSRPDLGVDAIAAMGEVLVGLGGLSAELAGSRPHPLLGTGSVHASLIAGGQELSSYPERCLLRLERRTVPGETLADVEAQIAGIASGATVRSTFERAPFEVAADAPIVSAVRRHAVTVLGREPATVGHAAWMDAAVLSAAGIPTVVFGPTGEGAHAIEEWVDLDSVERCAQVLEAVAREWCA